MRYGKIRIDDGNLIYTRQLRLNSLPCKDILWAYLRREGRDEAELKGTQKRLPVNYLVIVTRRHKRYQFDMSEKEIRECLRLLRVLNPEMAVGYPKGARITQKSLPNTRDLGALMADDGRHIIPRKLLRSGNLYHISLSDQETLTEGYHLTTVVDFRTRAERSRMPDEKLPGVEYYHLPILDDESKGRVTSGVVELLLHYRGNLEDLLLQQYENMVTDPVSLTNFANFIDLVMSHGDGSLLWHSNLGKDRAGVATAFLLCALGFSPKSVKEDYLRSNLYMEAELECIVRQMENKTIVDRTVMNNINACFRVKERYLDLVFETIYKKYGSIDRFMRRGLYLTSKNIETLRERYLI